MFHEIKIPNETRQQRSKTKKNGSTVRPQGILVREGSRSKRSPQSHQNTRDYANEDASARGPFSCLQLAIRFAVQNHRGDGAKYSRRKHVDIAAVLLDVAQHHAHYQRDPYGDWKCCRKSHQINSGHKQKIREVKNHSEI